MSGMIWSAHRDEGNDMVTGLAPDKVYDQIREGGGLYIRPGMDAHTEWLEGLDVGMRRVLGSTAISSNTLDEWADEFGMSANRLLRTLQKATTVGDRESPQMIEERMMKHYGIDPENEEVRGYEATIYTADVNTATKEEMQTITGIGPKLATLIVANQPFYAINQGVFKVSELRGIGKVKIREILKHYEVKKYEVAEATPF